MMLSYYSCKVSQVEASLVCLGSALHVDGARVKSTNTTTIRKILLSVKPKTSILTMVVPTFFPHLLLLPLWNLETTRKEYSYSPMDKLVTNKRSSTTVIASALTTTTPKFLLSELAMDVTKTWLKELLKQAEEATASLVTTIQKTLRLKLLIL